MTYGTTKVFYAIGTMDNRKFKALNDTVKKMIVYTNTKQNP